MGKSAVDVNVNISFCKNIFNKKIMDMDKEEIFRKTSG